MLNNDYLIKYINFTSSIQTVTVGFGIAPNQLLRSSRTVTAGQELHPAPKDILFDKLSLMFILQYGICGWLSRKYVVIFGERAFSPRVCGKLMRKFLGLACSRAAVSHGSFPFRAAFPAIQFA